MYHLAAECKKMYKFSSSILVQILSTFVRKFCIKTVQMPSIGKLLKCSKIKGFLALIGVLAKAQPSMGNNPMVGATVAVAVAVENASK